MRHRAFRLRPSACLALCAALVATGAARPVAADGLDAEEDSQAHADAQFAERSLAVAGLEHADSETQPQGPLLLTAADSAQRRRVVLQLDDVRGEQAATSTLLPWVTLAIGTGVAVLGTALGVERVLRCQPSCPGPFWPTWMVVGGATVATAGLVWLRLVHEDLAALKSRSYHLERQLDAYEAYRAPPVALAPSLGLEAHF